MRLLAGLLWVLSGAAHAQAPGEGVVELGWNAPSDCPDAAHVLADVAGLSGRAPLERDEPLVIVADVQEPEPGVWQLQFSVEGSDAGPRQVGGSSCEQVARATALFIALALDPDAGGQPDEPVRPEPASSRPTPAVPVPRPRPRTAPDAPLEVRWHMRASIATDLGTLPRVAAGPSLALGLSVGDLRAELTGTFFFDQTVTVADGVDPEETDARGDLGLVTGGVRGCFAPELGVISIVGCAAVEIGELRGVGRGVTTPQSSARLWLVLLSGGAITWNPVPALAVQLQLDLGINPWTPVFEIQPWGALHQPSRIVFRSALGVELRLP